MKTSASIRRISVLFTVALLCVGPSLQARQPRASTDLLVTTEWLAVHAGDPGLSILHVGADRKSYDAGHIPGARFVALSQLVVEREGLPNELPLAADLAARLGALGVGDSGRILLYGDRQGLLAARAFFTLDYLGHGDRAALLDGGLEKWKAEGRPLSTDEPSVATATFTPHVRPEVLVVLPEIRDISWAAAKSAAGGWALVDARPEAQFSGKQAEADIPRPGHIPGAGSLFWQRTLVSPENPVLRPEAELRRMFADAGAAPGARVVTYCKTGVQASFAYFVARYLGLPVAMYDGSFLEWSRDRELPVSTETR